MINYESLKQAASDLRQRGVRVQVSDLVTLAPKNDPFYAGAPAQVRDGEWFANLYHQVASGQAGVHLRRVHYRILDLPEAERNLPITLSTVLTDASGRKQTLELTAYENYQRCWDFLTEAAKSARYLNLVPINAFVDNRAKESSFSFYTRWLKEGDWGYEDPTPGYQVHKDEYYAPWQQDLPELPELDSLPDLDELPRLEALGYAVQQPYHIEIWVEKSEGEDVFLPLCQRYNVNFVPGVGDMSISTTYRFAERVREAGRPAKLLYISDFDPSGFNMPVAVARKLEHFCRNYGFNDLDITLEPIMLTAKQVDLFNLPPMPVKDTDARKDIWEQMYGGAVELNAMFARDERIVAARRIIEQAILKYYDTGLERRARDQKNLLAEALESRRQEVLQNHTNEREVLQEDYNTLDDEWENIRWEFDALIDPLRERLTAYRERLEALKERGADLWGRITDDLTNISLDAETEYPLPDPEVQTETDDLLFHSKRGYWSQLRAYHQHKDNGSNPDLSDLLDLLADREEGDNV